MNPLTQTRIDRIVTAAYHGQISEEALRGLILSTLREQDRDTRHACAEAIAFSTVQPCSSETNEAIARAHSACMNAHAI